jgi:ABC-type transport system involved in multi-copper enzyme maturation permease subunit
MLRFHAYSHPFANLFQLMLVTSPGHAPLTAQRPTRVSNPMTTRPAQAPAARIASASAVTAQKSPNPLLTVLRWELRRALASRATLTISALLVGFLVLLLIFSLQVQDYSVSGVAYAPHGTPIQRTLSGIVTRNSLFGLAIIFPITLLEFGLFLPFVSADGVSLDLKRHTHEILMTSALPSRAYIWGRYLAALLAAFGMACLLLLALLLVGVGLHLHAPDYYPALDLPGTLVIWVVVVIPPTLVFTSLCFAFGLLLPRQSNLVKAGAVFIWFAFGLVLQAFVFDQVRYGTGYPQGNLPAWWTAYETWQPTNTDSGHLFLEQFLHRLNAILTNGALSAQQAQQRATALYGQMPDLGSFAAAHVVWIVVGAAAVALASLSFRRFRSVIA